MDPEKFLRDLSPGRATAAFGLALVISATLILINWGSVLAWVVFPLIPIIVYTGVLFASQQFYFVSHPPGVKTSPYILGFLLTLVALFSLFDRAGSGLVSGTVDQTLLVGQVGAAIMSTAVGLLGRQLLITTDRVEQSQNEIYVSLTSQLKKNAAEFDLAQRSLVSLIQEFVSTREGLFSKEEQALQGFIKGLERGSQILTEIETAYPKRLQAALDGMRAHVTDLGGAVGEATQRVSELCAAAQDGGAGIVSTGERTEGLLSQSAQRWERASFGLTNSLTASAETLSKAAGEARMLHGEFGAAQQALKGIAQQLEQLPVQVGVSVRKMDDEFRARNEEVSSSLSSLLQDVKAMDAILDEVTTLLRGRVESMKSHG